MPTVTFSGLASGLDTAKLIDGLVQIERRPITLLQNQQSKLRDKIKLYQDLQGKLGSLKTAATRLSAAASFFVQKVTSSNESVLVATVSTGAGVANHTVTVNTLARGSTLGSVTFDDVDTTTVGTGTLAITVGTTTTDVTIDSTNNTLQGLRDAINDSGADVTASIVTVNAGATPSYRLVVSGKNTGLVNAVSLDESSLNGGTAPGFTTTQAAQDATLTIDGIAIARATNTISDVITGVTLDLKSPSATELQVTINNDNEAIKTQINDLVQAYNNVISFIATQTKYDGATEKGGPLIGDSALRMLQRNLQLVITTPVTGVPSILGEIGVATQKDGTLSVNDAKLSSALQTDLSGVSNLFLSTTNGVAQATVGVVNDATRLGTGILPVRIDGTQNAIDRVADQIVRKEAALERYEQDLVRRFTALETLISRIQVQGNFLTQQLLSLSAQYKK